MQSILWTPQWGYARNIQACPACAQHWMNVQHQGYPQPGYPQAGYAQAGYPQPGYDYGRQQRQGPGWGGVAAAGAAGLVGGMVIGELMDDDHPGVVENIHVVNEYNDFDGGGFDGGYDDGGGSDW